MLGGVGCDPPLIIKNVKISVANDRLRQSFKHNRTEQWLSITKTMKHLKKIDKILV